MDQVPDQPLMTRNIRELMNLEGRVALVTGGAGNIGSTVCAALAELGATVAVLDLLEEDCERVAADVKSSTGSDAFGLVVDLTRHMQIKNVPIKILDRVGRLDILVHCAALVASSDLRGWSAPFEDQEYEAWQMAIDINLTAPFLLTQACQGLLEKSKHGSVITFGSIYGIAGPDMQLYKGTTMGNPAGYAATKGGIIQLTRWLAAVMAPRVRVNCISAGGMLRDQPQQFQDRYVKSTPLGRMSREEDVKGAVVYLASDMSEYVTGHNLLVDGGWTVW